MVRNSSSFICGGSIIGGITLLLLQACLPINVVATTAIAIEDSHYHYHLHNDKNKHNDYEQQAIIISRRRRRLRRTASNNNDNVDCAWHADMITRDGCTNDDNCKFICFC